MKTKLFFLIALLLLTLASAATVKVTRTFADAEPGQPLKVTFTFEPTGAVSSFDLADLIAPSLSFSDWSVVGYAKSDVSFDSSSRDYAGETFKALHWKLNQPFSSKVSLSYTLSSVPAGTHKFLAIWTFPGGFNQEEATTKVEAKPKYTPPVCGNAACEAGESCSSCAADCGACPVVQPPVCGNANCESTESCSTCPGDCGYCPTERVTDMKEVTTAPDFSRLLKSLGQALPVVAAALGLLVLFTVLKTTVLAPKAPKTDSYMKGASQAIHGAVKGEFSTLAPPTSENYSPVPPIPSIVTPATVSTEERIKALDAAVKRLSRMTDEIGKGL